MKYPDVFDGSKVYIVSNWTPEDFTFYWDGKPTTIKAGEQKELVEYLAYHATKHLVSREMERDGVPYPHTDGARVPYEEKTLFDTTSGGDSPVITALKDRLRKELGEEMSSSSAKEEAPAEKQEEFADLKGK